MSISCIQVPMNKTEKSSKRIVGFSGPSLLFGQQFLILSNISSLSSTRKATAVCKKPI